MTREELFEAIGEMEISSLAKSEQGMGEPNRKKTTITMGRVLRNLLVAAVIASLLAMTAYAVAGYVLYDNPEDMISAIFGNKTGFDHKPYTEVPAYDKPGTMYGLPEYDRAEADPKVVQEDVAPYVSPVGKSITFKDMTLTVDSFLYDSGTKCGVVTYVLTNPPEYDISYDGRLYMLINGRAAVAFNQYGYDYIIQEKTTEDTLAAAYYFWYDPQRDSKEWEETFGEKSEFSVSLYMETEEKTFEEIDQECMEEVRRTYTPEEAIAEAKAYYWEVFEEEVPIYYPGYESEADGAYRILRDRLIQEHYDSEAVEERSTSPDKIVFDCSRSSGIENITLGNSGVTLSPISMRVDFRKMEFLSEEDKATSFDISVVFTDGTEYLVEGKNANGESVENKLFSNMTAVEFKPDQPNEILTIMFNRVIDLDQVTSVKINGTELTRD